MSKMSRSGAAFVGALLVGACAAEAPDQQVEEQTAAQSVAPAPAAEQPTVRIVSPADGSTVRGSNVHVAFEVTGLVIAPAGTTDPGTGHHHIFFDTELTPLDAPVPVGIPGIIHLGQAQLEHHLEGIEPGEHRIIAVVADGAHVPLNPAVIDTVVFTVEP